MRWHTDLDQATNEAQKTKRPILSLALLGRLDEEQSCANSRFFRLTLYPHPSVNRTLRERFVLHWRSVRPVPKVTINFGDGRIIERTVTGNSAHLILDQTGRPADVIPGLYGAGAFLQALEEGARATREMNKLREHHQQRLRKLEAAGAAERRAASEIEPLSAESIALIKKRLPGAREAGAIAKSKRVMEDPLLRLITQLGRTIAEDTAHNEHQLHRKIHGWFARGEAPHDREEMVAKLYEELFLMPLDDPWLGLGEATL